MGLEVYGKYEGAKHSCLFKTEEGYIIKSVPYNVVNGMEFQKTLFEISNPYTIHNMNLWISLNCEEGTKLISTEYFGAKELYTYRCSCGKEYKTNWQYFRKSDFKCPSCSKRQSSLETKVKDWLDENNINYIQQYSFNDCRNIYPLKFDFYLPLPNKIVEVDGEQHFSPVRFGGITEKESSENFEKVKRNDKLKNNYCEKNDIPILRIAYFEFDDNNTYINKLEDFTG